MSNFLYCISVVSFDLGFLGNIFIGLVNFSSSLVDVLPGAFVLGCGGGLGLGVFILHMSGRKFLGDIGKVALGGSLAGGANAATGRLIDHLTGGNQGGGQAPGQVPAPAPGSVPGQGAAPAPGSAPAPAAPTNTSTPGSSAPGSSAPAQS